MRLAQEYGDRAKLLAGGTDLLGLMKDRIDGQACRCPTCLINVKTHPGHRPRSRNSRRRAPDRRRPSRWPTSSGIPR